MAERTLTLEYWKDGDWYVGQLREVPGVMSQGASLQELGQNIRDAYQLVMKERRREFSNPRAKAKRIAVPA